MSVVSVPHSMPVFVFLYSSYVLSSWMFGVLSLAILLPQEIKKVLTFRKCNGRWRAMLDRCRPVGSDLFMP